METVTQLGLEGDDKTILAGRLITTVSFDQRRLLEDILELHIDGDRFELDPCYGYGGFYQRIPEPDLKFDLEPKVPGVLTADVRQLPIPGGTIRSAIFDPPFIAGNANAADSIMGGRYGFLESIEELYAFFESSLQELGRVMSWTGSLVVKCQDFIYGRTNYPIVPVVYHLALLAGFYPRDVFILVNSSRPIRSNMQVQNHARKAHSYFVVLSRSPKRSRFFLGKLPYENSKLRDSYVRVSKRAKWLRAALDLAEGGTTDIEILETMARRED